MSAAVERSLGTLACVVAAAAVAACGAAGSPSVSRATGGGAQTQASAGTTLVRHVVLLGDSLFFSVGVSPGEDFASVISRDRPDLEVTDSGVPGDTTASVLARLPAVIALHPDMVVVWIGTNDALDGVSLSVYRKELNQLLDLLEPAQELLVTPIADMSAPALYMPFAQAVVQTAAQRHLPVVDLSDAIEPGDYLADGAHLNPAAIQRVAALVARQIPRG